MGIENVIVKITHGVQEALSEGDKVIKVVENVQQITPAFKTELGVLIDDMKPIAAALAPAIATGGANVTIDVSVMLQTAPALVKLVKDFTGFLPILESTVNMVKTTMEPAPAPVQSAGPNETTVATATVATSAV